MSYNESLSSRLYPGNTLSKDVLEQSICALESLLGIVPWQRRQIWIRIDAGFGTDRNLDWLLSQDYQLIAKGLSGSRAGAWGKRVTDWQPIEADRRWVAQPAQQLHFCRPTRTIAVRWRDRRGKMKHALYVATDFEKPIDELAKLYDLRAGLEVDIREDKQGLLLTHRRKRLWHAQEILVLLNDLAHNFLAMIRREFLADTPLANFGIQRIINDVLTIPGQVVLDENGFLQQLCLQETHPYAEVMADILPDLWR